MNAGLNASAKKESKISLETTVFLLTCLACHSFRLAFSRKPFQYLPCQVTFLKRSKRPNKILHSMNNLLRSCLDKKKFYYIVPKVPKVLGCEQQSWEEPIEGCTLLDFMENLDHFKARTEQVLFFLFQLNSDFT